ncbi:hypothetical protein OB2597_02802 [Pseudooceanicola batsensis HTCC2597]|uniref:Uncharacterized protein n=1 Tax=Pseudooceanicola batsensis (strain ATCC BAA-863 / DSM 15984 / KCTC 12145 / HTCC2597) TaxID=252305 RepID=A3TXF4_PSEBH|nr:hypothetical protein OB2597_02802 [Pseudooceanicola batsensis HTCC2597]
MYDLRHKFATERYYFRYLTQEQQAVAYADGNVGL